MDPLNQIIFDDKSFSDLLKEIHKNQNKKSKQLASLIAELRPLITSLGDATIVQRLSTGTTNTGDGGMLTEEEMEQLQQVAEEISKTVEPKKINPPDGL